MWLKLTGNEAKAKAKEEVEKAMEEKGAGREVCSKRRERALVETYSVKLPHG